MMDFVPQLVGESGFSKFFGEFRFLGENLTVFEVQMAFAFREPPDKKLKFKLE